VTYSACQQCRCRTVAEEIDVIDNKGKKICNIAGVYNAPFSKAGGDGNGHRPLLCCRTCVTLLPFLVLSLVISVPPGLACVTLPRYPSERIPRYLTLTPYIGTEQYKASQVMSKKFHQEMYSALQYISSVVLFSWLRLLFKVPQEKKHQHCLRPSPPKRTPFKRTKSDIATAFLPDYCDGFRQ
jgi:hypothetical protein